MANSKSNATLGDYFTLQRGTTYKSALLGESGPVLLGLASIQRNGGFRGDSLKTYGGVSPANLLVRPGDLFVSLKDVTQAGDLLGSIARMPEHVPLGRLTQDTVRLDPRDSDVPMEYVYWVMRSPGYREYCRAHATGTTNLGLPRSDFLAFPVPDLDARRSTVVRVLESLERKIELNRRKSETLEEMSRALFKSWFVDFDPVRAKAEGRHTGLPPHIADLFPDRLVDSELGEIPEGWTRRPLPDIAKFLNGLALQKYPAAPGDPSLPVIKIAQLRALNTGGADRASSLVPREYVVEAGDLLFSWSGSLLVDYWSGEPGALNQHLFKVTPLGGHDLAFVRQGVLLHLDRFRDIAAHKATTMGHIKRGDLNDSLVAVPPNRICAYLEARLTAIDARIIALRAENRSVADARDSLLRELIG